MAMPPQDPRAEHALLARMKRGDEEAFLALYRRHKDAVYRFALLYSGSAAVAADVTQDTFVHLITQPGQFDPTRGSVGAWLCGVARNLARKHFAGREDATDPALLADDGHAHQAHVDPETPLDRVLRSESAEQVRRAIAAIAPHYRDVLVLCEISGMSYAEAAQTCGIDIGTVRSRLSRARAQLAQRLADYASPAHGAAKEAV
ncbi:MAG TPA: RNA polymerase sigma factor [Usitatibacter sp.]|nr:RNA polymerase sigma factor [Usitatibacter sp.]